VTYHEKLVDYLVSCPDTAVIAVPLGNLAAAGTIPNVSIIEHDAYYNEFRAADGSVLARVIFSE
jgi:hypothetical protein